MPPAGQFGVNKFKWANRRYIADAFALYCSNTSGVVKVSVKGGLHESFYHLFFNPNVFVNETWTMKADLDKGAKWCPLKVRHFFNRCTSGIAIKRLSLSFRYLLKMHSQPLNRNRGWISLGVICYKLITLPANVKICSPSYGNQRKDHQMLWKF